MEIKIGNFYTNKTKRFLYPCLKGYGDPFVTKFNLTYKLAVGIHDQTVEDTFSYKENKLYILFDTMYNPRNFESFLKWVKNEPYFIYDYVFSKDCKQNRMRMLILQVPIEYEDSYQAFLKGMYSKMYNKKQLDFLWKQKTDDYHILCNSPVAKKNMLVKIRDEFEIFDDVSYFNSIEESELPLKNKEEIFNFVGEDYFFNKENKVL